MTTDTVKQFHFTGSLTKDDSKTYHPHTFEVPAGTTNIHVDFAFTPFYATGRIHRNQIDLSFNDPDGIRGVWNRVKAEGADINGIYSTPGIGSWPIQPGTWTVFVAAHRILPPDTVTYELAISLSDEPLTIVAPQYDGSQRVANANHGWYRGDLHAHTIHSDGWWDIPEFTAYMRGQGLDFVTLSDHNTVTGLAQHRSQTEDGFLAMGGMELSTFNGHMLALGSSHLYEWRLNITEGMDINRIMKQVIDKGDMLIIAHPMSVDEPFCSGCMWQFEDARPGVALGVEIWNEFWHPFNEEGLKQYYLWLSLGNKLVATSGTDIHHAPPPNIPRRMGYNVVYAESLSEQAILDAVRKGHLYVSGGPELLLTAEMASGEKAMCGDVLPAGAATISVKWSSAHEGDHLRLIVDGKVKEDRPVAPAGEQLWSLNLDEMSWCTVELRDEQFDLWAVSNPVFFGEGWS
ncbi:MAG: CehA/McbA family metallohydrolase [Anaerolineaceae bacterium]|nr:CehA/McbA family metallohydrolase [Anaerolineaceae bacterium]